MLALVVRSFVGMEVGGWWGGGECGWGKRLCCDIVTYPGLKLFCRSRGMAMHVVRAFPLVLH